MAKKTSTLTYTQYQKILDIWDRAESNDPWRKDWVQREVLNISHGSWERIRKDDMYSTTREVMKRAQKKINELRKKQLQEAEDAFKTHSEDRGSQISRKDQIELLAREMLQRENIPESEWPYRDDFRKAAKKIVEGK